MSELPWNKKKNEDYNDDDNQITGDGSPPEPPSFDVVPDVLLNAFDNEPMEDVEKLEPVEPDENEYSAESETTKSPPFDGVPDLTNHLSGSTENTGDAVSGVDKLSDEMFNSDYKPLDEQQSNLSFDKGSTSPDENDNFYDTNINEADTEKSSESEIEIKFVTEDEPNAGSESGSEEVSNEIDSASVSDESGDFPSSFKRKFKSIIKRRNLFDQLNEAQSKGQTIAKPVNKFSDANKSLDTIKNKFQNISYDGNLTDSIEQLSKKVDKFQTQTTQNVENSADNGGSSVEPSSSPQDQDIGSANDSEHPALGEPEDHAPFEDLSNNPESKDSLEESKFETTNEKSDQQPLFETVTGTKKTEPDNQEKSAYIDKFNDLTASYKNKFQNIRKKTADSNGQTKNLDKTSHNTDDLTPPPLFEPRIPEEVVDADERSEGTDEVLSDNEFDENDEKFRFSNIAKLKPKFEKLLSPFKVLFKGSPNHRSLKNQMEQMREEIEEGEQEESTPEFFPPFEQENYEVEKEKSSKIGKISGFFKGINHRGGLKKRMIHFRDGVTGSEEDFEFDSSAVGVRSQEQYTGHSDGLSFEQVDRLVNKKLNEHQKQVKNAVDKKVDKVFSKEYMDYIASRVSTNQAGNLQELQSKVNGSTNRVEKFTDDLQNLSNSVDKLEESLREIQKRTEDFESKIDNTYYSTSDRIDNIEYQLKNLQDTLGIIPDSNEKVSSIETRIDEIEGALDSVQSDNQDVKAELSNIQQSVSDMYNSYKDLLSHLNEVNDYYESKFSDLYDKVAKIDTVYSKISEIQKSTKNRDESLSKLEAEISVIKNAVKRNRKDNQALANSIEDLKESSAIARTENKETKPTASGKNVQLEYIPKNSFSMKICMEWVKYLMNQMGGNNLDEVLTYYMDLGWISDNVRQELLRYSEGINQTSEKSDWKLTKTDHIKSIWFIQKLAGSNFDFDSLQNIENDVNQIKESN